MTTVRDETTAGGIETREWTWQIQHICGWPFFGIGRYVLYVETGRWWSMWVVFVSGFAFSFHMPK